jgi:type II secretory pathway component PulF
MSVTELDNSPYTSAGANADASHGGDTFAPEIDRDDFAWNSPHEDDHAPKKGQGRSIRKQDVAEVTSQLAIMTRSGVNIASALASLANQCRRPALATVLNDVHESVLAGNPLSTSLRQHADVFDPSYIATVAAGEASGKMSVVLQQLAHSQRNEIRSRRTMKALLTYPLLLLVVSSSVILALVLFVLPRFESIFTQYEMTLPVVTQMLMGLASELHSRWWLWFPLVLTAIGGLFAWRRTAGGRSQLDSLWLGLPVISGVYRFQIVGRMCRILGLMLESGVPLLDVLKLTRQAIGNVHYKELLGNMQEAVVNGRNLASALQSSEIVPVSAREMLITAEATGNLGEVTRLLGDYYEEEAEAKMRQVVGLLEPIITIGMGLIVAVVVLAVMLPVFDLSTLAQHGR